MSRRLQVLLALLIAPLALAAFAAWCGLLTWRTPAQRALVARMMEPTPPLGSRNAYPLLWLSRYELSDEQIEHHITQDVAQWRALMAQPDSRIVRKARLEFASTAAGKYPSLPSTYGWPTICFPWEIDCLDRVRVDPAVARALVARLSGYLPRLDRLAGFDHATNPFGPHTAGIRLNLSTFLGTGLTDAALRHLDGDSAGASQRLCALAATWRRLRARTDDLSVDASGISMLVASLRLHADMRAELPDAPAQSPECEAVFAPLEDAEYDQCTAWRANYRASTEPMDALALAGPEGLGWFERVGYWRDERNPDRIETAQLVDETYCSEAHRERIRTRARIEIADDYGHCTAGERVFHPMRCAQVELTSSRMGDFHDSLLDLDAWLALHGLAQSLARLPPGARRAAFEARAIPLIEATHPVEFDPQAQVLTTPLLVPRREPRIVMPLPGSRVAGVARPMPPE